MLIRQKIALVFLLTALVLNQTIKAQFLPTHISNHGIYDFLDELADLKVIDLNTAIKPYSRSIITEMLTLAVSKTYQLNIRQNFELQFYLDEYIQDHQNNLDNSQHTSWLWVNKLSEHRLHFFYYNDSAFRISVDPILGGDLWSNANGTFHHWWNGLETQAWYGNFALYASVRDNHESVALTGRQYMNQRIGFSNFKAFTGTTKKDYWEVRGGMTYEWNWGKIGLLMDQFSWGNHANGSNIFSGRTPAFTRLDLQLNPAEWLQFNYLHGWLVSEMVDSTLSFWVNNSYGTDFREVYHPKFLAANMFTFKPFSHFYIGIGNSVVYDYRSPHAAFFIPVMFWKPLDHTLNAMINNMNSQIFSTFSSRNIKGVHLYGSAFIDEVQVGRIFRKGEYNFTSIKAGIAWQLFTTLTYRLEYTWSNALVFQHNVPTTTFESNHYNLGHFLEDNAQDLYAAVELKPWRTLTVKGYYNLSRKGPDHTLLGTIPRTPITPLEEIVWESSRIGIAASVQVIPGLYLRMGYEWRELTGEQDWVERWTPEVYFEKTGTFNIGLNYGF